MGTPKMLFFIKKNAISNIAVWFFLSGFFATFYYQTVLFTSMDWVPNWFEGILNGNAASPYNYRLLAPILFTFIDSISSLDLKLNYFISTFMIFLFSTGSLMKAISFSISKPSSVIALLFSSFFILLTFPLGGVQPWSYVDIGLYSVAYIALVKAWSTPSYIFILLLSIFNRETGIFLSVIPLLIQFITNDFKLSMTHYKKEIVVLLSGIAFFLVIRIFQGSATHVITITEVVSRNFSPQTFIINIFIYAGAFLWFFTGKKLNFSYIEKAFLIILMFNILLILFFGLFREIRMFVPYAFFFGLIFARKVK
jgi:hypothetical protein